MNQNTNTAAIATAIVLAMLPVESFIWVKKAVNADGNYDIPETADGAAYTDVSLTIEDSLTKLNANGLAQKALDENWQLMKCKVVPTYLPKKAIKASMPAIVVNPPVDGGEVTTETAPVVENTELPAPPAEIDVDVTTVVTEAPVVADDKSWLHDDSDDAVETYEPEVAVAGDEEKIAA